MTATSSTATLGRKLLDLQWSYTHMDENRQFGADDAAIETMRQEIADEYEAALSELVRRSA